jgi:hypothetical protein
MQGTIKSRDVPLLIYFLLAIPFESLFTFPMIANPAYKDWLLLLYLGPFLEAAAILLTLFTLWKRLNRREQYVEETPGIKHRYVFIVVGIGVGWLTTAAWSQVFFYLTKLSGEARLHSRQNAC